MELITDFAYNPAMLALMIFGAVEFVKQLGVEGNSLRMWSLVLGLILATAFRLPEIFPQYAVFFEIGFFGLAGGITASGVYGFVNERLPKKD